MTREEAEMRARNSIERARLELRRVLDILTADLRSEHGEAAAQMARDRLEALDEVLVEEEVIHGVALGVLMRGGLS